MPTIKFHTLGCKVNQYETQAIREACLKRGFKEAGNGKADCYVINTCTVTSAADRKSREYIYRSVRENPKAKVIVTGCYVEKDRDKITGIEGVDLIISNEQKNVISDLLLSKEIKPVGRNNQKFTDLEISNFFDHDKAFVKIQDGCDNHCSYCKVSVVRGRSRSRDFQSIVKETERLIKNGFQEIVLTGICLGAYGRDLKQGTDLVSVIDSIEKLDGDFRIRLSSIEAKDVTDKLIDRIAGSKKMCRHLHIPFQSGDDSVLKKMNRKYTAESYIELVNRIRKEIPQIAITTDIMVGFTQETEKRFKNTVGFLKEIKPSRVHIFPFSPREHTPAYCFGERIDSATTKARMLILQGLAREMSYQYRKKFLHKILEVLVEQQIEKETGFFQGYSDNYIKTFINSKKPILGNKLKKVKITAVTPDSSLSVPV
ncbi:MAG: tRNA (N(6)-L-threonylcarbamoyladenosine(37)-C(2))-methylthiotransferase MtaB [Candidatus Omnitrophica bacterium]|nr:tRNA (N(6)-L-threonylcarbamoyladenosine(37)-C(2))-methylthiotransferase MtaB [Candidatus Omnitrophota bacterium]HOX54752.1 tRNA (N(6)-L-threonylcarbamoyladenosine(37)-C(2))-methylthiotransferase MtaB [Candidatus Omnitrophota bacterium]